MFPHAMVKVTQLLVTMFARGTQQNYVETAVQVKTNYTWIVAQEMLLQCYTVDLLLAFVSRGSQS
jgi:hypothetical protein